MDMRVNKHFIEVKWVFKFSIFEGFLFSLDLRQQQDKIFLFEKFVTKFLMAKSFDVIKVTETLFVHVSLLSLTCNKMD